MASISKQPRGRRTIQFVGADGRRRSIRLGKVSQRQAEAVKVKVEQLVAAAISGHAVDAETSRWVAGLDEVLADRLAAVGLIPQRENVTLGPFIDAYIESRHDTKESTTSLYRQTRRNLVEFFGANKQIRDITPGDADEWRLWMLEKGRVGGGPLGDNTVRRRCGRAKQFFNAALRKRLVTENPFADLKSAVQANAARFHFVTREESDKVMGTCPNAEWRLLFALSRYGGLRCPSEHLSLRWGDVDWEHGRMTVRSPKTERHVGGESRVVPLFPELRPHLEEVFDAAEAGTEFVITRYRSTNANLRTQFLRIVRRAGVQTWQKPFQNLRSTRETELAEEFPLHVVTAWLGNSQPVAAKHYLQVTDDHFSKAVQNPVQQAHASPRNDSQAASPGHEKTPVLQGCASECDDLLEGKAPRVGLEPTT